MTGRMRLIKTRSANGRIFLIYSRKSKRKKKEEKNETTKKEATVAITYSRGHSDWNMREFKNETKPNIKKPRY